MNKKFFAYACVCLLSLLPSFVAAQVPRSNHVVVVMEENHSYSSVIGNSAMPYLNSLASHYALATQYYANTHPSIGNYFQISAGRIITNNDGSTATVTADNMVRHMLSAARTWRSYAEGLPSVGYIGGDTGSYTEHHNPFSYFSDVRNSSVERLNLVPASRFLTDVSNHTLPQFSFLVPDNANNGHNGSLAQADSWLKAHVAPLLSSTAFQQDGILIILFDESFSSDTVHGGGHVAAVVIGPKVKRGYRSTLFYQHQSVLRTVLQALGVSSYPGAAATAPAMTDLF
jgi:phospholipase C